MILHLSCLSATDDCCMKRLESAVLPLLSTGQRASIERFRRVPDRHLRVLVRALLACGLLEADGWAPSDTLPRLYAETLGRPAVRGVGRSVSFSHAGDMGACLIGEKNPAGEGIAGVGVDIECLRDVTPRELAPAFSVEELETIERAVDTQGELFSRWTVKEAMLKALGVGFLGEPSAVDVCACSSGLLHWRNLAAPQGYALAVAAPWPVEQVRVRTWSPEDCLSILEATYRGGKHFQ